MRAGLAFAREQARSPLTVALLVVLPVLFVVLAADSLSEFADVLGGSLLGDAATALAAGWSAAFVSGALGYFQVVSSRDADRRLALAGLGAGRLVAARVGASLMMVVLASAAALLALALSGGIVHPWHAAAAILGFALIYLGVGTLIGALIASPLEGSLAVAFIFILDVFSGPGMTEGEGSPLSVSRSAGDVLIAAAIGGRSSTGDWLELAAWVGGSLALASFVFARSARSRA